MIENSEVCKICMEITEEKNACDPGCLAKDRAIIILLSRITSETNTPSLRCSVTDCHKKATHWAYTNSFELISRVPMCSSHKNRLGGRIESIERSAE